MITTVLRNRSPPVLTETLSDKKVKIGELVELGVAGMRDLTVSVPVSPTPPCSHSWVWTKECHLSSSKAISDFR